MSAIAVKEDTDFKLRNATENDIPLIYSFILNLARYEGFEDQVTATEDMLSEALFGNKPTARVVIGDYKGKPAGFALYYFNFSTYRGNRGLYLEDLYVNPDFRGLGLGTKLLSHLADIAIEENCGRMEWSVLDDNEPAINFYKSLDAFPKNERLIFRIKGDALNRLAAGE